MTEVARQLLQVVEKQEAWESLPALDEAGFVHASIRWRQGNPSARELETARRLVPMQKERSLAWLTRQQPELSLSGLRLGEALALRRQARDQGLDVYLGLP